MKPQKNRRLKYRDADIKPPGAGTATLELTKIDVVEAEICTAVRLFFEDSHPVPIYVLASAAREILMTIGSKVGVETTLEAVAKAYGVGLKAAIRDVNKLTNFFKHADRDPTATVSFSEDEVDGILFMACNDFGGVTGGLPIEAQVFQLWVKALAYERVSDAPLRDQSYIRFGIKKFPGIRSASRKEQKRLGLEFLNKSMDDPSLRIPHNREVTLAPKKQALDGGQLGSPAELD